MTILGEYGENISNEVQFEVPARPVSGSEGRRALSTFQVVHSSLFRRFEIVRPWLVVGETQSARGEVLVLGCVVVLLQWRSPYKYGYGRELTVHASCANTRSTDAA